MAQVMDLFLVYQFVKRLSTPWDKTEAFKLGLIDAKGKKLKTAETPEEKKALGYYDRLVYNLKRLLEKLPGGKTRLGSFAAAAFLMKEHNEREYSEEELLEGLLTEMMNMDDKTTKKLNELMEDAPANATGAAVSGTGDDPVHWKLDARKKQVKEFIRRYMESSAKRKKIKEKKDFLKQLGL